MEAGGTQAFVLTSLDRPGNLFWSLVNDGSGLSISTVQQVQQSLGSGHSVGSEPVNAAGQVVVRLDASHGVEAGQSYTVYLTVGDGTPVVVCMYMSGDCTLQGEANVGSDSQAQDIFGNYAVPTEIISCTFATAGAPAPDTTPPPSTPPATTAAAAPTAQPTPAPTSAPTPAPTAAPPPPPLPPPPQVARSLRATFRLGGAVSGLTADKQVPTAVPCQLPYNLRADSVHR